MLYAYYIIYLNLKYDVFCAIGSAYIPTYFRVNYYNYLYSLTCDRRYLNVLKFYFDVYAELIFYPDRCG